MTKTDEKDAGKIRKRILKATSEPLADKTFDMYFLQCDAHNRILDVNIFSSENFSNLDHFKSSCQTLKTPDSERAYSTVRYKKEDKDIFTMYNLKDFAALRGVFDEDRSERTIGRK